MTDKDKAYLDSLDDELFIAFMWMRFGTRQPIWERCSKEEFEKYHGKIGDKITIESLLRYTEKFLDGKEYRAVPVYHNGGGIWDQISGREPDDYYYEKLVGYEDVILVGSEMADYCSNRECMKPYFKNL